MKLNLRGTGCHLPYGITRRYLPPDESEHIPFYREEGGTRFSYPGGMEGWVDLGDRLHTKVVTRPQMDTRPSTNPGVQVQESKLSN